LRFLPKRALNLAGSSASRQFMTQMEPVKLKVISKISRGQTTAFESVLLHSRWPHVGVEGDRTQSRALG